MAARGAGKPVNCSNWRAAWWTRRSRPVTSTWPRPAPDDPPTVEHRLGERGGPRVVDDLEDDRYVRAPRHHVVGLGGGRDRGDDDLADHLVVVQRQHLHDGGGRVPAEGGHGARGPVGVAHEQPDRPGAQVGQGQTRRRRGGSPAQDGRGAHRTRPHGPDRRRRPGDVGVVGVPPAVRVHEGVGHPRSYHRRRHLIGTRRRLPLQRRGDRQPSPRRVQAVHERREPTGRHPVRVVLPLQTAGVVRRPVQQRRQRVRDRVAQHPTDHGDQQLSDWVSQYSCSSPLKVRNSL